MEENMMGCINKKKNEKECICPETDCERHGICCECIRYHKKHGDGPNCLL